MPRLEQVLQQIFQIDFDLVRGHLKVAYENRNRGSPQQKDATA